MCSAFSHCDPAAGLCKRCRAISYIKGENILLELREYQVLNTDSALRYELFKDAVVTTQLSFTLLWKHPVWVNTNLISIPSGYEADCMLSSRTSRLRDT
jgi:hypothetical protein